MAHLFDATICRAGQLVTTGTSAPRRREDGTFTIAEFELGLGALCPALIGSGRKGCDKNNLWNLEATANSSQSQCYFLRFLMYS